MQRITTVLSVFLLLFIQNASSQYAFSTNYFAASSSVVNCATNTVQTTLPLGVNPEAVAVNPVKNKVYFTNATANSLNVINACNFGRDTTLANIGDGPVGIAVSPNGQRIYVCLYRQNIVRVFNANDYSVVASIVVGSNPSVTAPLGVVVSSDNSRVYATIFDEQKVAVIDAATNTVTGYYATDNRPVGLDVSNDGSKLYVVNQNSNTLIVFNTATGARIATTSLGALSPLVNGGAAGIVLNHANTRAYIAVQDANAVKVIDLATNAVSQTIPVGGRPFGIDILPDDSRVYTGCVTANRFDVINTITNAVVTTVATGNGPYTFGKFIIPKAIDSVRILKTTLACNQYQFQGQAFGTNANIVSWQWDFGDGGTAGGQNVTHLFPFGNYVVKLVATSAAGCKDSITINVSSSVLNADAGNDSTVCVATPFNLLAHGTGIVGYAWSPATLLDNSTIANPTAIITQTTKFYVTVTNAVGCTVTDSVTYTVQFGNLNTTADSPICKGDALQLNTTGAASYSWTPAAGLSATNIPNPVASPAVTTRYYVTGTAPGGCPGIDSVLVTVNSLPAITVSSGSFSCAGGVQLNVGGALTYSWSPAASLNNANISNPVANPTVNTQYYVTGIDANGCRNIDSILINVNAAAAGKLYMPGAFTPNGDGKNDCYGIQFSGTVKDLQFLIFNRWGENVFKTENPNACWNGYFRGKVNPGNYVFYLVANTSCGPVKMKGNVILIR